MLKGSHGLRIRVKCRLDVLACLLESRPFRLFGQELDEVLLEDVEQVCRVKPEELDAFPQRRRADVRPVVAGPLLEDDEGAVGRALYSPTRYPAISPRATASTILSSDSIRAWKRW